MYQPAAMFTITTVPFLLLPALTSALALSEPFKPPDNSHQNQQRVLSLLDNHHHKPPKASIPGFISLGDSYSAGIGTRPDLPSPSDPCRQGLGAYPYLLASSLLPNRTNHQWLSCTGATTIDLLSSSPPSPDDSQIDTFQPSLGPPAFATLSIAGNDLDFFSLLNACVFRFYGWFSSETCEDALKKVEDTLSDSNNQKLKLRIKLILLEILDRVAWEHHPNFFITVTGYARFFNENTTECNDVSFGVWTSPSSSSSVRGGLPGTNGAKLTQSTRQKMNTFVLKANQLLADVVDEVNRSFLASSTSKTNKPKVLFVNYDTTFNTHRFCEPGVVKEPDYDRNETWFFLPGGRDVDQAGNVYTSTIPNKEEDDDEDEDKEDGVGYIDPDHCWEDAMQKGDWGEKTVCLMAKAKKEDPGLRLVEHYRHHCRGGGQGKGKRGAALWRKPGDSMWLTPTYYGKTFHPRSAGHEAIRDKIYQLWEEHGYLSRNLSRGTDLMKRMKTKNTHND
ncbi:SGNH hydrolase-type esterase domain-containing protein [Apiosordaria backusii]|uniref:SGNH hydrolase-type esterase domain-containing protein n=1 Tax=Apiosordaria backusii TaxID=314023 RepID=A0AA40BEJ4_9PEZI|nr:SGNH hydrolase-type esterase domain-containing protein [Apiosordaria backusii]